MRRGVVFQYILACRGVVFQSNIYPPGTAGFSPCFHVTGFHVGATPFLIHSHMIQNPRLPGPYPTSTRPSECPAGSAERKASPSVSSLEARKPKQVSQLPSQQQSGGTCTGTGTLKRKTVFQEPAPVQVSFWEGTWVVQQPYLSLLVIFLVVSHYVCRNLEGDHS